VETSLSAPFDDFGSVCLGMPKLWNLLLTVFLLVVAYFAIIALSYDGHCYGFSDGISPCSFIAYFAASLGFEFLLIFYFPHIFIIGAGIFYANDVVYRFVVRTRTRRWLEKALDEPTPHRFATSMKRRPFE
jgi:hypothetical protein